MRIRLNLEELGEEEKQGVSYISALSNSEMRALLQDKVIQLSLFAKELSEVENNGTRYILSKNPILEQQKNELRENLKQRFEDNILEIKRAWQKRRDQNLENQKKLKNGHKNKKLVIEFSNKKLDNYKFRASELLKRYKMTKFYQVEISNERFTINFLLEAYQQARLLDGKYVIETNVKKEEMETAEVRNKYKELQNVEHAFRDLKVDKLNIRPIFHRNAAQTRGHVFISMFSYAIIKEIEMAVYPWLKEYNKANHLKLAFKDIVSELNNIKLSELEIGYKMKKLMIPQLSPIQIEITKILNIKIEDMMKI